MIWVTTDEQLKAAVSAVTVDLSIDSLGSFLLEVESDFILLIGKLAKDELVALPDHIATVYIRAAAVNLALAAYASSGAMLISDAGMHVTKSDRNLPASDKKIVAFKRDRHKVGWGYFEKCVAQMEADAVAFPGWKASEERARYMALFVDYSFEFALYSKVNVSPDLYQRLRPEIRKTEIDVLAPVLGSAVWTELKSRKNGDGGDLDGKWQELLEQVLRALGPLALADALPYQMVEVGKDGVFQLSEAALSSTSDNIEARSVVQPRVMAGLLTRLVSEGEAELERLRKFLNANRATFEGAPDHEVAPMAKINEGLDDSNVYFL
ncbi:MAG TPA: DUF6712 family protein [Parapedobacter sp.]|uniref:DUF6712 family protein n=1 Tax=Parapedobacter sp. TaxID=1958893 RepID=UPI002B88AA6A|nr:DUF6712 family protein [Parapedobacter sp.]HWK58736.1 DUF6712 family protein [Parapedobacter sp.]